MSSIDCLMTKANPVSKQNACNLDIGNLHISHGQLFIVLYCIITMFLKVRRQCPKRADVPCSVEALQGTCSLPAVWKHWLALGELLGYLSSQYEVQVKWNKGRMINEHGSLVGTEVRPSPFCLWQRSQYWWTPDQKIRNNFWPIFSPF